jgi:alpha-tubulin suppressor-like RCC1 family protein
MAPVVVTGISMAKAISMGGMHSCALLTDNTVACWGENGTGQLGDGSTDNSPVPVIVPNLTEVAEVLSGGGHTCARLKDTTLRCWGLNYAGELGNGTLVDSATPVSVLSPSGASVFSGIVAFACGAGNTCAVTQEGQVYCWGGNDRGQIGDGTTIDRPLPTWVSGL